MGFRRYDDGAEAEALWEDEGSCGNAELSTRSADILKTVPKKRASTNTFEQLSIDLSYNVTVDETMCNRKKSKN